MTTQASCSHCGKKRAQGGLKAAPNGGAICKDWFRCQVTRDEAWANLPGGKPPRRRLGPVRRVRS